MRAPTKNWTIEQLKVTFYLYCQLPFGQLDSRNKEVQTLAKIIGRTPGAVAMKLVNFASLDPAITSTGRVGLGNASAKDRQVWDEFHANWEGLAIESEELLQQFGLPPPSDADDLANDFVLADYTGTTRKQLVETRMKQSFFRRAVLAIYKARCCMTGLAVPDLLLASHIIPWRKDRTNRLNPSNGLCLSAIHDRAFDKGFITVTTDHKVKVSKTLRDLPRNEFVSKALLDLDGSPITLPDRFIPDRAFLEFHNDIVFQK